MVRVGLTAKSVMLLRAKAAPGCAREEVRDGKQSNLILRVQPRGARWALRLSIKGKDRRLDLGSVDDWTLVEARELGSQANKMLRNRSGIPDSEWLHKQRIEYGKIETFAAEEEASRPATTDKWTFDKAREAYLSEVQRTLRPATHVDYGAMLHIKELAPLRDLPVGSIDRKTVSKIVQSVHHSGRERHAEHLASVIRPMWTWLAGDNQVAESSVVEGTMAGLKAPPRTRDDWTIPGYVPDMREIGRIVAIARASVFEPAISFAIELAAFSAQRRLTVVSARKCDFESTANGCLWKIPSAFLKSGSRRKSRNVHVVPLPKLIWDLVQRAMKETHDPDSDWLFPQFRPKRAGGRVAFMSASTLTRGLWLMPDVTASPHDIRRAFATHGEAVLGWKRMNSKSILDHGEGDEGSDVTAIHYALHYGAHHKWKTMKKWAKAIEDEVALAIAEDPRLKDRVWLKSRIDQRRYRDNQPDV